MRWTPSNSEREPGQALTRQLQNWKWPRRAAAAPPTPANGAVAKPICLSTVVMRDVILDFEAVILVIGGHRIFPKVPHFWIAAALLFADGEEVSTAALYAVRTGMPMSRASSLIARDIRSMRLGVFAHDPRIRVAATGRGYRLIWD